MEYMGSTISKHGPVEEDMKDVRSKCREHDYIKSGFTFLSAKIGLRQK